MVYFRSFIRTVATLVLATGAGWANADWTLDNSKSVLNFVTTKAVNVAEVHRFEQLSGSVNDRGEASLDIDLTSVNTGIPVRDERMQKFLFKTEQFPTASLHTQVPIDQVARLKAGEMESLTLEGNLGLRGLIAAVSSQVNVVKLADGSIQVDSVSPLLLQANQIGLVEGIEKLREIAGLPSIGQTVAVTFRLNFRP